MAKVVSLKEATNLALEKMTQVALANVLGVTPNQVYKYSVGETKSCRDNVVDAFYDNVLIDGEKVLVDYFKDEKEYLHYRKLRN